jgi:hypothetical protein
MEALVPTPLQNNGSATKPPAAKHLVTKRHAYYLPHQQSERNIENGLFEDLLSPAITPTLLLVFSSITTVQSNFFFNF